MKKMEKLEQLIEFYKEIPSKSWCKGVFTFETSKGEKKYCALGHLGVKHGIPAKTLNMLHFMGVSTADLADANDKRGVSSKISTISYLKKLLASKKK